jgi:hypothetical protein
VGVGIRNVQSYVMNGDRSKSTFEIEIFLTCFSIVLYSIVPQQHCLEYGQKHGPQLLIYK